MMTYELDTALNKIDRGLGQLGRQFLLSSMGPGLGKEEVARKLSSVRLPSTPAFEAVYGWHDGTVTDEGTLVDDIQMFPGFYQLTLEEATVNYRTFLPDSRWSQGWLPIFANGGGDFCVIDLSLSGVGVIRHFRIDEVYHPVEFLSLTDMMCTIAAGFEEELFYVDNRGYLEMDDDRFYDLAEAMNPNVDYWRA